MACRSGWPDYRIAYCRFDGEDENRGVGKPRKLPGAIGCRAFDRKATGIILKFCDAVGN